jgi:hypothetical protein
MSRLPMLACRDRKTRATLLRRSMTSRWATMPVLCFANYSTYTLIAPAKTGRAMSGESLARPCELDGLEDACTERTVKYSFSPIK